MTRSITEIVEDFIQYILSNVDSLNISGDKSKVRQELEVIRSLFSKYDDEQLKKLFEKLITEQILNQVKSFNSSSISSIVFAIPVKSTKNPKLRVGYLYRKFEDLALSHDHSQAHLDFMIKLLSIIDEVYDVSTQLGIYDRMKGNLPQVSNLTGILESIPGVNNTINSFLSPELINTLKDRLADSKDKEMTPEMIKSIVDDILDKIPQLEAQKPFLKGILENILKNPESLSKFTTNPSLAIGSILGGDLSSILPLLTGGSAPPSGQGTPDMKDLMEFNPYA